MAGSNFSEADISCMLTQTFSVVSVTVACIVCAFTVFGNVLILISIYKYPTQLKGSLYFFIGNLAAADLLLGIWSLLFVLEEIFPELEQIWYFCATKPVGILVSYTCSILSLLGISFDRFMAVMFPLTHLIKTHKREVFILNISGIWIVSIITGSLPIILPYLKPPVNSFVCRIGLIIPDDFQVIAAVILLVTLLLNIVLYGIVLWKIKYNKTPGNNTGRKKNTKTMLMIFVFVLFVICWMPFIISTFLLQAGLPVSMFENILCASEYLARLGYINSSLNWIIYGLANKKFRTAFKKVLKCKCCDMPANPAPFSTKSEGRRAISSRYQLGYSIDPNGHIVRSDIRKYSCQTCNESNEREAAIQLDNDEREIADAGYKVQKY